MMEKRRTVVPRHVRAGIDDIVAFQGGDWNEMDVFEGEAGGHVVVVAADFVIDFLRPVHQIHLVDGHDDMNDAEQRDDERVALRLDGHAVACVYENDGEIAVGGASRHVARILFMSRRIGDDELPFGRGEVAICDIDGDALFAFGLEAVRQEGGIKIRVGRAVFLRVMADGGELVFVDHLGIVE